MNEIHGGTGVQSSSVQVTFQLNHHRTHGIVWFMALLARVKSAEVRDYSGERAPLLRRPAKFFGRMYQSILLGKEPSFREPSLRAVDGNYLVFDGVLRKQALSATNERSGTPTSCPKFDAR